MSGKKAKVAAWAAAAFLVFSAMKAAYPANAMPQRKASTTTSANPAGPAATLSPSARAMSITSTTWAVSTIALAIIGPQITESLRVGVRSSLVK